jgi:prolipoprotein diacylglyceryltransferase
MYLKTNAKNRQGLIFGVFLVCVFLFRFLVEFIKQDQEAFEQGMLLNMGQLLSIPFIIGGIVLIYLALTKPPVSESVKPSPANKKK